jgi:gentisate 1,2-dioxygenase
MRANPFGSIEQLIAGIGQQHCVPGWISHERPLLWPSPVSALVPAHWEYARIHPALVDAGRLIGTDRAERRNFILRNPVPGNDFATTRTLIGAYQSILPGERARSHRHSPHALRVILDSRGSYSVVNGRKHPMETGDIVLTPGGCWHGHGHEGGEQAFWFDCLDIPLVQMLEPMSSEEYPGGWEPDIVEEASSPMRLAWSDTRRLLGEAAQQDAPHARFGATVELPAPALPTISIKVHRMPEGWDGLAYRHSASSIFVVLQGSGCSSIGAARFGWKFGDVMAAPMGLVLRHEAQEEAVLVELSDEKLMRYCGFYRSEQGGALQ